jgi:hypothetical protein
MAHVCHTCQEWKDTQRVELCSECASKIKESPAIAGNKQIMPCECVHGESLEGLCNACADTHGSEFRLIRTA